MRSLLLFWTITLFCVSGVPIRAEQTMAPPVATFSIVAFDPAMQEWGVAVQSRFLAVGSVVPFAKADVGAIASQAWGHTGYGREGLALLEMGVSAPDVITVLTGKDEQRGYRQVGIVDHRGRAAAFTGEKCNPWAGHVIGDGYCVQGNILTGESVVTAMAQAFASSVGTLGQRLLTALAAGQTAGGDSRGKQSAALLVTREAAGYSGFDDRFIDLRVDDHPDPIAELSRLYQLHEKTFQASGYITSAVKLLERGEQGRANLCFDHAIKLADKYPNEALLLNGLAWELATHDLRLEDALRLAKAAVKLEPTDANVWDTLGEAHSRLGQYAEAAAAEQQAVDLAPDSSDFTERRDKWAAAAGTGQQ